MRKLSVLLIAIIIIMTLAGCSGNNGIPEGMQPVRQDEGLGYYMYAPEEWTVVNLPDISKAYASRVDLSSVSYTEIEPPLSSAVEYFKDSLSEFPDGYDDLKVTTMGEEEDFGNADKAYKFIYEFTYLEHKFKVMQILASYDGRFGIFTYTSYNENISSDEKTQFDYYYDKVRSVMDNFKYTELGKVSADEFDIVDSDGYKLTSDKKLCGFELYAPLDYTVNYSSGIVSISAADGSTVTLSRATATGVRIGEYFDTRIEELENIVTDIEIAEREIKGVKFGELQEKDVIAYEYTYKFNGKCYRVYQIFGVTRMRGYVFTYTATENNYGEHLEEVKKIAEKVIF